MATSKPTQKKSTEARAKNCLYDGKTFSNGAVLSQDGMRMQCRDGTWIHIAIKGPTPKGATETK
jgi:hypothetical protein